MKFIHKNILPLLMLLTSCHPTQNPESYYLITGSYTAAEEESVKVFAFDDQAGVATYLTGARGVTNPTFLCTDSAEEVIYAVGEYDEDELATINAFRFDCKRTGDAQTTGFSQTPSLTLFSTKQNWAGAPCNITLDPTERFLLSANYCGGSVSIITLEEDGALGDWHAIQYHGQGAIPERQEKPHLHAVNFTPDGKFLLANDLGTDCIHVHPVLKEWGTEEGDMPLVDLINGYKLEVDAGAGPRHLCFAPDGTHAYLLTELSGQLFTLTYDGASLRVVDAQVADTLHAGGSADIHVTSDGRFLYASHRLQGDGISIYQIDPQTGLPQRIGYQLTGVHPRNFTLSPSERFLLVACRDSNRIQILERDAQTGLLRDTGRYIDTPKPMFVKFLKRVAN